MEHVTGPSVHNCHEYMHIIFFYHVAALHFPIALVESQCLEVRRNLFVLISKQQSRLS